MRRITACLLALAFAFISAEPASAWFWEKKNVEAPKVTSEVGQGSNEAAAPVKKKGLWTRFREGFLGVKKDVKESSKKGAKTVKEGSRETGKDMKEAGRRVGQDSKKLPGELKKSGKAIGQGFKQLGKGIKKGTREVFVGEPEQSEK